MRLFLLFWIGSGLSGLALIYIWAGRPFRLLESLAILLCGPIFLGCITVFFACSRSMKGSIPAHGVTKRTQDVTLGLQEQPLAIVDKLPNSCAQPSAKHAAA